MTLLLVNWVILQRISKNGGFWPNLEQAMVSKSEKGLGGEIISDDFR